jgi:hypothetical protein
MAACRVLNVRHDPKAAVNPYAPKWAQQRFDWAKGSEALPSAEESLKNLPVDCPGVIDPGEDPLAEQSASEPLGGRT